MVFDDCTVSSVSGSASINYEIYWKTNQGYYALLGLLLASERLLRLQKTYQFVLSNPLSLVLNHL